MKYLVIGCFVQLKGFILFHLNRQIKFQVEKIGRLGDIHYLITASGLVILPDIDHF